MKFEMPKMNIVSFNQFESVAGLTGPTIGEGDSSVQDE